MVSKIDSLKKGASKAVTKTKELALSGVNKAKGIAKSGVDLVAKKQIEKIMNKLDKMAEDCLTLKTDLEVSIKAGLVDEDTKPITQGYIEFLDKAVKLIEELADYISKALLKFDNIRPERREELLERVKEEDNMSVYVRQVLDEASLHLKHLKEFYIAERDVELKDRRQEIASKRGNDRFTR